MLSIVNLKKMKVNCRYENIIKGLSDVLDSGFLLTFDYGFLQKELYNPARFNGTYRCYFKHDISETPYINIGYQDITCSVDFSSIINLGKQYGLKTMKYTTQGQFLVDWGILELIENVPEEQRTTVKNLILPQTMGDKFKVLIQLKNIKSFEPGFYPESEFKICYQCINDRIEN